MRLGSLVHCAVLEPDDLDKRYGICLPRNTKAGKEMEGEMIAAGIEAVTAAEMEQAMAMAGSVRSHQAAAALLQDGKAEQSFWWNDTTTGLRCKCRPDWYFGSTIVDLKTTVDASPAGFAASVAKWRYHVQQSHYLSGTFADRFIFIAVEKNYPFAVGVYELDDDAKQHGQALRQQNLQQLADCHLINEWPGYSETIEPLSLPRWAFKTTDVMTSDDF
jgi:exodeoxyribonuclease VIII